MNRRIAWVSPLPPEPSGIADYSVEILAELRHQIEPELFCGQPAEVPHTLTGLTARSYAELPSVHAARPYDAIIYHIGNNARYHSEIYRAALRVPGIIVLHEYMLHDLLRGTCGRDGFVEAMAYCYGASGRAAAQRLLGGEQLPGKWAFPLFEQVVDASVAVIVHSDATRRRVLRSRPSARIFRVPFPLALGDMPSAAGAELDQLRRQLGLNGAGLVVASFGVVNRAKRIDIVLQAFQQLRRTRPEAQYVLAGEISPEYAEVQDLLAGPLGEGVLVAGRLPLTTMMGFMSVVDVAVNLRYPHGGETSGTCVRLLGLGRSVIVSTGGWFSDIPEGCCAHLAPGPREVEELGAMLEALGSDDGLRMDMGAAAARWARREHDLRRVVEAYDNVAAQCQTSGALPARDLPPVPEFDGHADTGLMLDVIDAAARLGISDDDTLLLPDLAEMLVEVGVPRDSA